MTATRQSKLDAYQAALKEASATVASRDLQAAFANRKNGQLAARSQRPEQQGVGH